MSGEKMQTWVLVLIVSSTLSGKPALGPSGISSVPGYISAKTCEDAGAELKQKDAVQRLSRDAEKSLSGPERNFVQIEFHCIPGPPLK